jgi:transcription termination/antitermination protein NusA
VTTVEGLADMTPEQLEEIPGIGEKTLEKISVAVRHYFGQYEEGEERPAVIAAAPNAEGTLAINKETSSMEKTPEEILATEFGGGAQRAEEVRGLSAEEIEAGEDNRSDALSDADAREEKIELENDAVDTLVDESEDRATEGPDEQPERE